MIKRGKRKVFSLANYEAAKIRPLGSTISTDRSSLFMESKNILDDCLAQYFDNSLTVPALQFSGLNLELVSLRLVSDGLYIGVTEGKAAIPKNVARLKDFRQVVNLLMKFKVMIIRTKCLLALNLTNIRNIGSSDGCIVFPPKQNKL
jgi:hypothetical protein